ncbi:MAG TPA: albusnodin family lasso peptide [Pseudonocardiaceae bacterium]|nr:albusnodin family lasso peptide [Pseudonocardiaceae bacterium]
MHDVGYGSNQKQKGKIMWKGITQQRDGKAAVSESRVQLGETTKLTLGSGGGTSEDKRYLYN